jgi:hypothetical protein
MHYFCTSLIFNMKRFLGWHADSAGFVASLVCAIHCSAIPVLISLGLIGSGSWLHNHAFDWIIIGLGFVFAGYSIVGDYLSRHRKIYPVLMAFTGFAFLLIGMIEHHGWMLIFSVLGGILVASSHLLNWKYSQYCRVIS